MPKFVLVTNEEVSAIAEEGSCSKETVQRRNRAMKSFKESADLASLTGLGIET